MMKKNELNFAGDDNRVPLNMYLNDMNQMVITQGQDIVVISHERFEAIRDFLNEVIKQSERAQ